MEKNTLSATKRTVLGAKVKKMRRDGILPANLYGKKIKSEAIQLFPKDFEKVFAKAGESSLVELLIDKKIHPVLIHNVQRHPVTDSAIHVDFYQVDLKEKVTTRVPLVFTGESIAVKDKLGVLLTLQTEVEVEALPGDLPDKIEVDISKLAALDQVIKIGALAVSEKVKIMTDKNQDVVKVVPLISKEAEKLAKEEAEAKAAAAAAAPTPAEGSPAAKEGAEPAPSAVPAQNAQAPTEKTKQAKP